MNVRAFIITLALAFASCVYRPMQTTAKRTPKLESVRYSADWSLQLRLLGGHPNFRYELTTRDTGKVLCHAVSAINLDHFSNGEFRGEQIVLFSKDNNAICIVEDTSDACPAKRYILFQKKTSGRYSVRYLNPALDPNPSIGTFEGDYPSVIALTADTITFSRAVGSPHPQTIASVPTFSTPQTAIY